ncbi:hypothetical protein OUE_0726 [Helicobacter pylori R030b]|uniref:hypothetical protein n=1 Tax=Helicobacter pylori TaxID=210 RepID=UPI0002862703|nr:hypothetical protein [Helicobacter pylori]EKE82643.1 hypothetical protein OUE_0726 [Helicobacter pylori R030b]
MELAKVEGVETSQLEKARDYLSLSYYYGFKDIDETRHTEKWIFLEARNSFGRCVGVSMLFDFMCELPNR